MAIFPIVDLSGLTDSDNKTIVELRTKLEIRTWFLRFSLAFNVALLTGFLVRLAIG